MIRCVPNASKPWSRPPSSSKKNQCYFAGAIQIASSHYTTQQILWGANLDLYNTNFLFTTATNGFVPTVFTLVLVCLFGRRSWYLILLSSTVLVLSMVSLCCSSWLWRVVLSGDPDLGDLKGVMNPISSCGNVNADDISLSWCGTKHVLSERGLNVSVESRYVWTMWAHSLLWLVYCIGKKTHAKRRLQAKAPPSLFKFPHCLVSPSRKITAMLWRVEFTIGWALCFGYQFYLYSQIFTSSAVDTSWTFGQIVAIVVWAPSLVEYFNLEYSTFDISA